MQLIIYTNILATEVVNKHVVMNTVEHGCGLFLFQVIQTFQPPIFDYFSQKHIGKEDKLAVHFDATDKLPEDPDISSEEEEIDITILNHEVMLKLSFKVQLFSWYLLLMWSLNSIHIKCVPFCNRFLADGLCIASKAVQ